MRTEKIAQLLAELQALPTEPAGGHLSDEEFVAFVLEEMAPAQEARIEAHLATCPHCTEELDAFFTAAETFPQAEWAQRRPAFVRQLRARLQETGALDSVGAAAPPLEPTQQPVGTGGGAEPVGDWLSDDALVGYGMEPLPHQVALGTPSTGQEVPRWWRQLSQQLQYWATMLFLPRPPWAVALGGVAVAFLLGWGLGDALRHQPTAPVVQPDSGPQSVGYGFGTSASSQPLLTIPGDQVSAIEITPSLRDALANPTQGKLSQVHIRLTDGTLIIEEAPR